MKASKRTIPAGNRAAIKVGYDLPSHDALAKILPNSRYPFKGAKAELPRDQEKPAERPEASQANKPDINHTYQVHQSHKRPPLHDFEDDPNMAEITDLQTKEMENYRSAMSKMAEDIIALRTRVVTLEAENSRLHTDLSLQQDHGPHLLEDADIDVMTKAEIVDRFVSLKFKLASETSKAASQRDRIQQLQNDLIKKNDSEKQLMQLQRVHQLQAENLQRHQSHRAEMTTLEVTVKQQEKVNCNVSPLLRLVHPSPSQRGTLLSFNNSLKCSDYLPWTFIPFFQVIEKMEKALDGKLREKNKQRVVKTLVGKKQRGDTGLPKEESELSPAAENSRLRGEPDRMRRQQAAQTKESLPVEEKLSLLNKLETAEARVQTLEAQLEENCELWGRQKQGMLTQLSEHRHGFVRTSTTILHHVPSRAVS
ncbi:coiled-coil domain-containing protein 33 isoform X1 [Pseudoliparis swirei]|uniref:coiled-coil domain-containing protein 33 isoform X1 n=1 Tax=Pseudoliparis swirei TaxID=2059687 RepID=UPI0024BEFDDF|nr:coiled-coil domain-containing protein 33 isoform X1 [Pseudoliparis swirei]